VKTNAKKEIANSPKVDRCQEILEATKTAFESWERKEHEEVIVNSVGAIKMRLSARQLPRAMEFLEAFIRACEAKGWEVEPIEGGEAEGSRRGPFVRIQGDRVGFHLNERRRKIEGSKTDPTGLLAVEISTYFSRLRGTWADGKKQRLEGMINGILAGIEQVAIAERPRRLEHEAWRTRMKKNAEKERVLRNRKEVETPKRIELLDQVDEWHRSLAIARLVAEVRQSAKNETLGRPRTLNVGRDGHFRSLTNSARLETDTSNVRSTKNFTKLISIAKSTGSQKSIFTICRHGIRTLCFAVSAAGTAVNDQLASRSRTIIGGGTYLADAKLR
jgi:hypothetical protein